jgi:hypothetical protein
MASGVQAQSPESDLEAASGRRSTVDDVKDAYKALCDKLRDASSIFPQNELKVRSNVLNCDVTYRF